MGEVFIVDSEFVSIQLPSEGWSSQRMEVSMEINEDLSYRQSCGLRLMQVSAVLTLSTLPVFIKIMFGTLQSVLLA